MVLGKVKLSQPFALSGISEKRNPILMKWNSLSGNSWGYGDKSLVVLGKVKLSRPFARSGISEKSNPILMKWNKPVR